MSDTGANMAPWGGFYGGGGSGAPATTEATVVTTTAAAAAVGGASVSSPTSGGSGGGSPTRAQQHQQPGVGGVEGGRVGKPARRRSRASRRAPVTLLNTDTSNFRAMVQQFTGIPAGPNGPAGGGGGAGGGPVISFGGGEYGGAQLVRPSPTSAVTSFHDLAAAHAHHQQHRPTATSLQSQLFRPQHQQQQYGGDVGYGMHAGGGGDGMAPSFLHGGFESSSAEDRLLLQSMMQAAQTTMPTGHRPASTNNNGNGYNFG